MKKVAIYIRVSTDRQAKTGDSLAEQMETLTNYVNDHENMVLYDTYIDDGVSGQKLNRDSFQRLIGDVKSGNIDLIIFTKLDRWFRSLRHYLNTQAVLEKHNVEWDAVAQPFYDTTTPQGRAFVAQSMTFAELEAQNDSVRIKDVFEYKYKRGEVLSGKTPLGYSIKDKHLVLNDDAEKVVSIFKYYDKTNSVNDTLRYMEKEYNLIRSRDTLKRNILQNKKYIGVYKDNSNFCPPIIDQDLFDRVQYKLSKNIKCSQKRTYLFTGLIVCDCCGYNFFANYQIMRKPGNKNVYGYKRYRCRNKVLRRCNNKSNLNETAIEKYLIDNIKGLLSNYMAKYKVQQKKNMDINKKRETIQKKINKLKDLYVNDLITLEEFKTDKEEYLKELDRLSDAPKTKDITGIEKFLKMDIKSQYEGLNDKEKRYFWRSIIKEIRVDADRNMDVIFL